MEKKLILILGLSVTLILISASCTGSINVTLNENHPPILSDGLVYPTKITQKSLYVYFRVHYYDEDGDPPLSGPLTNYVLVKKTDPGTPYTGMHDMIVKNPFSHDTNMFIYHYPNFFSSYRIGNYSVRFVVMWDDTTSPCSYVYYPPLDEDPLTFEVVKSNSRNRFYQNGIMFMQQLLRNILKILKAT